jgi:hypothetical protein
MSVTPFLMMDSLAEQRRRDVKAQFGARRRTRRTEIEVPRDSDAVRAGLLARFRHVPAA